MDSCAGLQTEFDRESLYIIRAIHRSRSVVLESESTAPRRHAIVGDSLESPTPPVDSDLFAALAIRRQANWGAMDGGWAGRRRKLCGVVTTRCKPRFVHAELRVVSAVFQKQYADRHGLRPQVYRLRATGGDAGNVRLRDEIIIVRAAASLRHQACPS